MAVNGGDYYYEEMERKIYIEIKKNGAKTASQMSEITGISKRNVERILREMKEKGVIVRLGSDRRGRWIIKE